MDDVSHGEQEPRQRADSRPIIVAIAVAVVVIVAYLVIAVPGMDHGSGGQAGMGSMEPSDMAVDVDDFALGWHRRLHSW